MNKRLVALKTLTHFLFRDRMSPFNHTFTNPCHCQISRVHMQVKHNESKAAFTRRSQQNQL